MAASTQSSLKLVYFCAMLSATRWSSCCRGRQRLKSDYWKRGRATDLDQRHVRSVPGRKQDGAVRTVTQEFRLRLDVLHAGPVVRNVWSAVDASNLEER